MPPEVRGFRPWITHVQKPGTEALLKRAALAGDVISLAGALPAEALFPSEGLERALREVIDHGSAEALQYHWPEGYQPLREHIAAWMHDQGLPATPAQVLVTHGAQQGLQLLGRLLARRGEAIAVESPTYLAALQAFELLELTLAPVKRTAEGLDLAGLAQVLERGVRLVYLVPVGHNPTGAALTEDERQAVVALLDRHDAWLIDDQAYGALSYDGDARPLYGLHPRAVYLGSFSKVLAPGLRIGWIAGPEDLIRELTLVKQAADLQTASLNQMVLARWLEQETFASHAAHVNQQYRLKRDALVDALVRWLPAGVQWAPPTGGFSAWLELADGVDAEALLPHAIDAGVAFEPGRPFVVGGTRRNVVRLSFSALEVDAIGRGVERLAGVLGERVP